jgi:hypothetical protein
MRFAFTLPPSRGRLHALRKPFYAENRCTSREGGARFSLDPFTFFSYSFLFSRNPDGFLCNDRGKALPGDVPQREAFCALEKMASVSRRRDVGRLDHALTTLSAVVRLEVYLWEK